jgi:hypothetical protein
VHHAYTDDRRSDTGGVDYYRKFMGGFTDADYGDRRAPRRRPRGFGGVVHPETYVAATRLDETVLGSPEMVDSARARTAAQANRWAEEHGYEIIGGEWDTYRDDDPTDRIVTMRLTVRLQPITTGTWGEIRRAIEEDVADRREAERERAGLPALPEPPDAYTTVTGRIKRLRDAADIWTARDPFNRSTPRRPPSAARDGTLWHCSPPS